MGRRYVRKKILYGTSKRRTVGNMKHAKRRVEIDDGSGGVAWALAMDGRAVIVI